jgi:hypothetical protein
MVNSSGQSFGPTSVVAISGTFSRSYRVKIPSLATGSYTLRIGPNIRDFAGNLMDQDRDGLKGESLQDRFTRTFSITDDDRDPWRDRTW